VGTAAGKRGVRVRFEIWGSFGGKSECLDEFESKEEAEEMLREYRLAFGGWWKLWLKAAP
jgi:hypothetical protein